MTTRRRNGFQDLKEVESESELESAVSVSEEPVETPEESKEVKTKPEPVSEKPQPEPEPKVLPVRLLERPKLPERQRNVPRFSRTKH